MFWHQWEGSDDSVDNWLNSDASFFVDFFAIKCFCGKAIFAFNCYCACLPITSEKKTFPFFYIMSHTPPPKRKCSKLTLSNTLTTSHNSSEKNLIINTLFTFFVVMLWKPLNFRKKAHGVHCSPALKGLSGHTNVRIDLKILSAAS